MKCPSCGAEARDGSRFCMSCGVDLSGDSALGFDPSEAETVIAPVLRPDADKPRAASLGPSGDLPDMGNKPAEAAPPTAPP